MKKGFYKRLLALALAIVIVLHTGVLDSAAWLFASNGEGTSETQPAVTQPAESNPAPSQPVQGGSTQETLNLTPGGGQESQPAPSTPAVTTPATAPAQTTPAAAQPAETAPAATGAAETQPAASTPGETVPATTTSETAASTTEAATTDGATAAEEQQNTVSITVTVNGVIDGQTQLLSQKELRFTEGVENLPFEVKLDKEGYTLQVTDSALTYNPSTGLYETSFARPEENKSVTITVTYTKKDEAAPVTITVKFQAKDAASGAVQDMYTEAVTFTAEETSKTFTFTPPAMEMMTAKVEDASAVSNGDGSYTITFTRPEADTDYPLVITYAPAGSEGEELVDVTKEIPFRATYVFTAEGVEVSRQILKKGETPIQPASPEKAGHKFTGWVDENGNAFSAAAVGELTADVTYHFTAQFEEVYYVFFLNESGAVHATREGKPGDTIPADVTFPVDADKSITGWYRDAGLTQKADSVKLDHANITLYPKVEKGFWLNFDSQGGTYIAPQFYHAGEKTVKPADPTQPGYTFNGWTSGGAAYTFGSALTANVDLVAQWTASTNTNYTVIHWWENADDEEYSFHESETRTGTTGAKVTPTPNSYEGFDALPVEEATIAGDGSTIINIKYDRKEYTVYFYSNSGGTRGALICTNTSWWHSHDDDCYEWTYEVLHSITAKHGAQIGDKWPGGIWRVSQGSTRSQSYLAVMPIGGEDFYSSTSGSTTYTATYYVQVLPGQTGTKTNGGISYIVHHQDIVKSNSNSLNVTDEERYALTGFTNEPSKGTQNGTGYNNSEFYYTRNQYAIKFMNNGALAKSENKYYQESLEGVSFTPERPAGLPADYVFQGWYDNELGQGTEYNFSGTMPANNITVYAKWAAPQFTGTIHLTMAGTGGTQEIDIPYGTKIDENSLPAVTIPAGYTWRGWAQLINGAYIPFNFDTVLYGDITLYPYYTNDTEHTITYDANGGSGEVPDDTKKYVENASADVQPATGLTAPDGQVFLGWNTAADGSGEMYQPGDKILIPAENITLYAIWGEKVADTKFVYDANYSGKTEIVMVANNDVHELRGCMFTRTGYKFVGWSLNAGDDNSAHFQPGDDLLVDKNNAATNNVVYAVWEKVEFTVTYSYEGEVPESAPAVPGETKALLDTTVTVEAEPTLVGYEFSGWVTDDATVTGGTFTMPAQNVHFTGSWSVRNDMSYTVRYMWGDTPIADNKTVTGKTYLESVTESALAIDGYTAKNPTSQTVTIDGDDRTVTFHYYKNVTLTGNSSTVAYNGYNQTVSGYTCSEPGVTFDGLTQELCVANGKDAGTYDVAFSTVNPVGKIDTTDLYIVSDYVSGKLVINPIPLTITTPTQAWDFDGAEHSAPDGTVTGFVGNDGGTVTGTGKITYPGTVDNTPSLTVTAGTNLKNYTVVEQVGKLTVNNRSEKYQITVTPVSVEKTYDGIEVVIEGSDPALFVNGLSYTFNNVKYTVTGVTASGSGKDAGTTTITTSGDWKVTAPDGTDVTASFDVTLGTGSIVINKAPLTVTTGSGSWPFDGQTHTAPEASAEGFVEGEGAVVTAIGSVKYPGESVTNEYTITYNEGTNRDNYQITENLGTLTVTDRTEKYQITVKPLDKTETYDGTPKTVSGSGNALFVNGLTYVVEGNTYHVTGVTANGTGTDVGSYEITTSGTPVVTDANGKDVTASFDVTLDKGTLTIGKRTITVRSNTESKTYDRTALTGSSLQIISGTFADGHGITGKNFASITEVGSISNTFDYDLTGGATSANYEIITQEGTLTIEPVNDEIVIEITGKFLETTYDGQPHIVEGYDVKVTGSTTYNPKTDLKFTAGETKIRLESTDATEKLFMGLTAENFRNVNDNYAKVTIKTVTDGYLLVNKRDATLLSDTLSKTYDGTPLVNGNAPLTATGFVGDEGVIPTFTASVTEVGESVANAYTYVAKDGTNLDNYNIDAQTGTLSIDPISEITVTITGNKATKTYDGEPLDVTGYTYTVSGVSKDLYPASSFTFTGTERISQTNAGTTNMGLTPAQFRNTNPNYANVKFTIAADGYATVEKKTVTLTSVGGTKVYDGTPLTNSTVNGLEGFVAKDLDYVNIEVTGSQTLVGTSDNTFTTTFTDATIEGNYTVVPEYGELEVTKPTDETHVVEKTHSAPPAGDLYDVGDQITFTIKVCNVYDEEKTLNVSELGATIVGEVPEKLAPGQTITLTAVYTVTEADVEAQSYTNKVTVALGDVTFGDIDEVTEPEIEDGKHGVDVTKTADKTEAKVGDVITYTITVKNTGNRTLENVKVVDELVGLNETVTLAPYGTETFTKTYTVKITDILGDGKVVNVVTAGNDKADDNTTATTDVTSTVEVTEVYLNFGFRVYDGQPHTMEGVKEGTYTFDGQTMSFTGDSFTITDSTGTSLTFTVVPDGNATVTKTDVFEGVADNGDTAYMYHYTSENTILVAGGETLQEEILTHEGHLVMNQKDVTMKSEDLTKVYDGTPLVNGSTPMAQLSGFVTGEGVDIDFTASITNEGSTPNAYTYVAQEGTNLSNYNITEDQGTLTITAIGEIEVIITGNHDTKTYDGEALNVTGYTYEVVGISKDLYPTSSFTFTGIESISQTNAGTTYMGLTSAQFDNTNPNYANVKFTIAADGYATVEKKTVTLTSEGGTKVYDGTPLTNSTVNGKEGFVAKDLAVIETVVTGSQTLVGTSKNTFTTLFHDATIGNNYTVVPVYGDLEVTKPTDETHVVEKTHSAPPAGNLYDVGDVITFTIKVHNVYDEEKTLNVSELGATIVGEVPEKLAPDQIIYLTAEYVVTEEDVIAQSYTNKVTVTLGDVTFGDIDEVTEPEIEDGSYAIDVTKTGDLTTAEVDDTITYTITVKNTGNRTLTDVLVVDELVGLNETITLAPYGEKVYTKTYTVKITDILDDQKVINTATASNEQVSDTASFTTDVTSTVTASGVRLNDVTAVYDGQPHTAEGVSSGYYTYDGVKTAFTGDSFTVTDASGNSLTFTVVPDGNATVTKTDVYEGVPVNGDSYRGYIYDSENTILMAGGETVQENVQTYSGVLTMYRRPVTLTSGTKSKTFDGTPLYDHTVTVSAGEFVEGDGFVAGEETGVTYDFTGSEITNAGKKTNVFTYSMNPAVIKESNYSITTEYGELEVKALETKLQIALEPNSYEATYDGQTHSVTGLKQTEFTIGGVTYVVSGVTAGESGKDAGTKEIVITGTPVVKIKSSGLDVTEQFSVDTTAKGSFVINPRPLTLKSADAEKIYDGTALTAHEMQTEEGYVEGEKLTYTYSGTITEQGSTPNTYTVSDSTTAKVSNYKITENKGTLTIHKAEDFVVTIYGNNGGGVYNGSPYTATGYTFTVPAELNGIFTASDFTYEGEATVSGTDVGEYSMNLDITKFKLVDIKNFGSVSFQLGSDGVVTVTKRPLTLVSANASKVYDGTALTAHAMQTEDGYVEGEKLNYSYSGTITEVGTEPNAFTYSDSETAKASNYEINASSGTLEITAVTDEVIVTITGNKDSKVYDGEALTVSDYTVTTDALIDYDDIQYIPGGVPSVTIVDAETKALGLNVKQFKNLNPNYANVTFVVIDGEAKIEKRNVTLTSATKEKTFDGTALYDHTVTVTGDGFAKEEAAGVTYDFTGSEITNVGQITNKFTYKLDAAKIKASNYNITPVYGTLTVTDRTTKYEITLKPNSFETTYDGQPHSVSGLVQTVFTIEGVTYEVTGVSAGDNGKDACAKRDILIEGTPVVKIQGTNMVVTDQFTIQTEKGSFEIKQRELTLKSADAEKIYDGTALTAHEMQTEEGYVEGEKLTYTYSGTITEQGSTPNTYTVSDSTTAKVSNYKITENKGTLTIHKAEDFVVTIYGNNGGGVYNGSPYTAAGYTFTVPAELSGVFTASDFTYEGEATVSGTDVGEYSMNLDIAKFKLVDTKNFGNVSFELGRDGVVTVTKRPLTLVSANASKVYDGTALTAHAMQTEDGYVEGEKLNYSYSGTITEVGTEPNAFTYSDSETAKASNYEINASSGTLEITAVTDEVIVTITGNKDSKVYDGEALTVSDYTVTTDALIDYDDIQYVPGGVPSVTIVDAETKALGLDVKQFKNLNPNYANVTFVVIDGEAKIEKRDLTLLSATKSKTYDGTALVNGDTPMATVEGFAEGEGADFTFTASVTDVGASVENSYTVTPWDGSVEGQKLTKLSNYNVSQKYGTLSIDPINEITVHISGNIGQKVYDGAPMTVSGYEYTVTGTTKDLYPVSAFAFTGNDTVTRTNAGTTTMGLAPEQFHNTSPNFAKVTFVIDRDGSVKITPKAVELVSADDTKPYDGTALTNSTVTGTEGFVAADLKNIIIDVTGTQTLVGSSENVFTCTFANETVASNYTVKTVFGTLTVTKPTDDDHVVTKGHNAPPADNLYDVGDVITFQIKVHNVYDKTVKLNVTELGKNAKIVSAVPETLAPDETIYITAEYTVTEEDIIAQSYTNKINVTLDGVAFEDIDEVTEPEIEDSYFGIDVEKTGDMTTARVNDTITYTVTVTNTGNRTLDPVNVEDELVGFEDVITLAPGESKTYTLTYTVKITDILSEGTVENIAHANWEMVRDYDVFVTDVISNVEVGHVTLNSGEFTYDGQPHTVEGVKNGTYNFDGQTVNFTGDSFTITDTTGTSLTFTVVPDENATVTKTHVYEGVPYGNDTSVTYPYTSENTILVAGGATIQEGVPTIGGELIMNQRPATITTESHEQPFTGIALTGSEEDITLEGFVDGEGLANYRDFQSIVAPGQVDNSVDYDAATGTDLYDYTLTEEFGTLTITDQSYDITITSNSGEFLYDGTLKEVAGFEGISGEGVSGFAGTIVGEQGASVLTFQLNGVTFTVEGLSAYASAVNVNDLRPVAVAGLADVNIADYAATTDVYFSAGTAVITVGGQDVTAQFNIEKDFGTLTMIPRTLFISSQDYEKVYDGTALTNPAETETVTGPAMPEGSTLVLEGDGFAPGQGGTFTFTGTQTLIGSSENSFEFTAANDVTQTAMSIGNYVGEFNVGTLTITAPETIPEEDLVKAELSEAPEGGYGLGDKVIFSITLKNIFDSDAVATISEQAGVQFCDSDGSNPKNGPLTIEMAAGETITVYAVYTIQEKDLLGGKFVNTVNVELSSGMEKVGGSDEAEVTDLEEPNPHMTVVKTTVSEGTGPDGTYDLNETIRYEITVTNDGNVTLTNIQVTDTISGVEGAGSTLLEAPEGFNGTLEPGQSVTYTFEYVVTEADLEKTVVNVATASASNPTEEDQDPDNDKETEVDDDNAVTEDETSDIRHGLSVVKNILGYHNPYRIGETIFYQIIVRNDGNVTETNVYLDDDLIGGKAFATNFRITDVGAGKQVDGSSAILPVMLPNTTWVVTCQYTVHLDDAGTTIGNEATVSSDEVGKISAMAPWAQVEALYELNIYYVDEAFNELRDPHTEELFEGDPYRVVSPVIDGYVADITVVEGNMPGEDLWVYVIYHAIQDPNDPEPTYDLTPLEEEQTPLADVDLEHTCCIMHFLIMLVSTILLGWYTSDRKKYQARIMELRRSLAAENPNQTEDHDNEA